ncbi:MAG: Ribosomal large subunit pseudouridine synthase C [Anaerolineales bacterium]|nr:Ribosomal large subunit pseudouridine synthase C [Anaerolineales bacterium]
MFPVSRYNCRMNILHLDEHILVLDKPAGLPVLPDGWDQDAPYLVKSLTETHGKIYVVHRLDKVTSGVMVFARTAESHRSLSLQFEKHETAKTYHALAQGSPTWDEHRALHPLRVNVGHKHRTIVDVRSGKPSATRFRVLERFASTCLLEGIPETGRTHQIRVHAAALGHPLLADALYGSRVNEGMARPALHAQSLAFIHPASRELLAFNAPYPDDFSIALTRLRSAD